MHIAIIQHVDFETAGAILEWASECNHQVTECHTYQSDHSLDSIKDCDALIVLGGPMNIYQYDQYPWLKSEKQCIKDWASSGRPLLGICLGAQLIADCLGSTISQNPELEIGWFDIALTAETHAHPAFSHLPSTFNTMHWHGDTFGIPQGATLLGSSAATTNQGYILGNIIGLQFHMEWTPVQAKALIQHDPIEQTSRYVMNDSKIMAGAFNDQKAYLWPLLDQWLVTPAKTI